MNTISLAVISPNYMSKQTSVKQASSPSYNHWSQLRSNTETICFALCVWEGPNGRHPTVSSVPAYICSTV